MLHADGLPSLVNLSLNHNVEPTGVNPMGGENALIESLRAPCQRTKLLMLDERSLVRWLMVLSNKPVKKVVPLKSIGKVSMSKVLTRASVVKKLIELANQVRESNSRYVVDTAARYAVTMLQTDKTLKQVLENEKHVKGLKKEREECGAPLAPAPESESLTNTSPSAVDEVQESESLPDTTPSAVVEV